MSAFISKKMNVDLIKDKEIQAVYDHNIDAFSDSPDFKWNLEEIKNEIKVGLC